MFMPVDILVSGLLIIMIVGAVICLETEDTLSSIIILGMVGLILSLTFLILQAPDLALAQFIYEILILGLAFVVMNRVKPDDDSLKLADGISRRINAILILAIILGFGYFAMKDLPAFGNHSLQIAEHYLNNGAKETGAANLVAGITLDYRVYDTFGEAIIIFTGVLGALAITRTKGRNENGK
jgi:multisubunit Na+/H+ antiporter MnhB subunit